jgi:hypothetical protein
MFYKIISHPSKGVGFGCVYPGTPPENPLKGSRVYRFYFRACMYMRNQTTLPILLRHSMFAGNTSTPPLQYPFGKLIAYNIRWLTQIRNLFRITAEIALYFGSDNRSGFTIDHGRRIQARIVWTSNLRNFSTNPKKLSSFYPKPATQSPLSRLTLQKQQI